MSEAGLPVTKPVSAWNKPLQADWKALFKALADGVKHGALGKWEELPGAGVDLLASIGLKTTAGERAYLLIRRALTAAIHELVGEALATTALVLGEEEAIVEGFDWSLEDVDLRIERRFFDRPASLSMVEDLKAPLWELLVTFGLDPARATSVSNRLGTYFTFHLAQEWRESPGAYAPLQEALQGPFAEAAEREQGWILYDAWLQKQAEQPVFGESFSLKDIYIPLRGYWEQRAAEDREGPLPLEVVSRREGASRRAVEHEPGPGERRKGRVAVDLHEELEKWLDEVKPTFPIRLLSGGPGSGKSTFAKMLAASASRKGGRRVLYVPLHLLDVSADLVSALAGFVAGDRFLTGSPLDPKQGERGLFLILDGLDELALRGKVGAEVASGFVSEVRATVDRLNAQDADARVVITGRPVAVDPQRTHFRRPEQLLFVLPYEVEKSEQERFVNSEILEEDQRHLWWRRYGKCVNTGYEGLPKALDRPDLAEVTRQPLLNYLLALSFERGQVDFSKETSLNEIYADLLDAVYDRQWGPGGPHPAIGELDKERFGRILEEIAVAAWHGNGRTTSVQEIEARFRAIGLLPLLEQFTEGAQAGVGRLLLAFYFRAAGRREGGDPTFEFTHKSFGEYLVARRIVGMIETIHRQLRARKEDFEAGWDDRRALESWVELTGPTAMEMNLLGFLRREVALRNKKEVLRWQEDLARLLSRALEAGLPMERVMVGLPHKQMTSWARNAEGSLLAALNACARVSEKRSEIMWPTPVSLGDLVVRLRGQRTGPHVLPLTCLGLTQADMAILHIADLYAADLRGSSLQGAELFKACLSHAVLREANLEGATLGEASAEGADLRGAKLSKARLGRASMRGANLEGVTLENARMGGVYLRITNAKRANFRRAVLIEADLREADLQGANFFGADLRRADLTGAHLEGADLREANIRGADFRGAHLSGAKLTSQQIEDSGLPPKVLSRLRRSARIEKSR